MLLIPKPPGLGIIAEIAEQLHDSNPGRLGRTIEQLLTDNAFILDYSPNSPTDPVADMGRIIREHRPGLLPGAYWSGDPPIGMIIDALLASRWADDWIKGINRDKSDLIIHADNEGDEAAKVAALIASTSLADYIFSGSSDHESLF